MSAFFNKAAQLIGTGALDLTTAALEWVLVNATYTADRDHDFASQLNASGNAGLGALSELTASSGYVRGFGAPGRLALANPSLDEDDVNDRALLTADHAAWLAVTTTEQITYAVLVRRGFSDADSLLVLWLEGGDLPGPSGGLTSQDFILRFFDPTSTRGSIAALAT